MTLRASEFYVQHGQMWYRDTSSNLSPQILGFMERSVEFLVLTYQIYRFRYQMYHDSVRTIALKDNMLNKSANFK